MKTLALLIMILLNSSLLPAIEKAAERNANKSSNALGTLAISFDFKRGDKGSNQYAIWVEDGQGKLVRTIYVTNFTATGGYKSRPMCVPTWTSKANPSELTEATIDGFTGATPAGGTQTYYWDGKDDAGKMLPEGEYRFFIEGTLFRTDRVLFSGTVVLGTNKQENIPINTDFFAESDTNRDMLTGLRAGYTP